MKNTFSLLLFVAASVFGQTTWTIQTASCGAAPHCYSPVSVANINSAIAAAACGDTIQVEAYEVASAAASISSSSGPFLNYAKACAAGSEVTITTSADSSWLPDPADRILPSYRNLLGAISIDGPIKNNAAINLTSRSPVPSGVKFVGLWFRTTSGYSITDSANMYTYIGYIGTLSPTSTSDLPDDVTFDRTLVYSVNYSPNKSLSSVFLLNSKGFTFKNGFIGGLNGTTFTNGGGGYESKVFLVGAQAKPLTITNNVVCCGWTEGMLTGGNPKVFSSGNPMPANIDFERNVQINAGRFLVGYPGYLSSDRPMIKNCFELKEGTDAALRWNTCMNSWNYDAGQWFGTKLASYQESYSGAGCLGGSVTATLSTGANGANSRVTFNGTISGYWGSGMNNGGIAIGISKIASPHDTGCPTYFTDGEWEYHRVVAIINPTTHVYDVDVPYTQAYTTTNAHVMIVNNPWTSTQRVRVENNLYRNVAGNEFDGDSADYGLTHGLGFGDVMFRNNLMLVDDPNANLTAQGSVAPFLAKITWGATRFTIEHNQIVVQPQAPTGSKTWNSIIQMATDSGRPWAGLKFLSNLGPHTEYGGPTGAVLASYGGSDLLWMNNSYVGTAAAGNGANPNIPANCAAGQKCSGNIWDNWNGTNPDYRYRNAAENDFAILPAEVSVCGATNANPIVIQTCTTHSFLRGQQIRIQGVGGNTAANGQYEVCPSGSTFDSTHFPVCTEGWDNTVAGNGTYTSGGMVYFALYQGGADGSDVGVDQENVPLLRYLTVTPMQHSALFRWQVPSGMSDVGCQIEVTPTSNILTDDADYTVVNALRPDYFKRADADRSNPRATKSPDGRLRWFQVGDPSSATGDDGNSHDLSLASGTTYYYRLFCGGAMERGSFTTLASSSGTASIAVAAKATVSGATQVRPRYGAEAGSLTIGSAIACATGCWVPIPATAGRQIVYYLDQLDGNNNVTFTPDTPAVVAVR